VALRRAALWERFSGSRPTSFSMTAMPDRCCSRVGPRRVDGPGASPIPNPSSRNEVGRPSAPKLPLLLLPSCTYSWRRAASWKSLTGATDGKRKTLDLAHRFGPVKAPPRRVVGSRPDPRVGTILLAVGKGAA
jgi:hypothetical protein